MTPIGRGLLASAAALPPPLLLPLAPRVLAVGSNFGSSRFASSQIVRSFLFLLIVLEANGVADLNFPLRSYVKVGVRWCMGDHGGNDVRAVAVLVPRSVPAGSAVASASGSVPPSPCLDRARKGEFMMLAMSAHAIVYSHIGRQAGCLGNGCQA